MLLTSTSDTPTVFIVGAGASKEANLPLGSELTAQIAQSLSFFSEGRQLRTGEQVIYDALKIACQSGRWGSHPFSEYTGAARRIAAAMPQAISIDNYLDVHNENPIVELCGKLAIVFSILKAEATCALQLRQTKSGPRMSFADSKGTYFSRLFQIITENCKFALLPERLRKLCFVVFNYDRCVEHYLHYAIQNYYAVTPQEAADALTELRIFHPYGMVGSLSASPMESAVELGAEVSPQQLIDITARIRTFTEGTNPASSQITAIRQAISSCHRLVFLGFAYHRLNLELLAPAAVAGAVQTHRRIIGTGVGISTSDRELIGIDLARRFGAETRRVVVDQKVSCSELFVEYWRSLSLV